MSLVALWPWGELPPNFASLLFGNRSGRISYNLVRHSEFTAEPYVGGCLDGIRSGAPDKAPAARREPYSHRAPGYPFYLAAIFSTFPESDLRAWDAVCQETCVPPAPLPRRVFQVTAVPAAITVAGALALTLFLGGGWVAAVAAGGGLLLWSFKELDSVGPNGHIAAFLLLGHAAFAALMWRRPRIAAGVSSGIALGLLVLTNAIFQFWLVGIAVVLAGGLWFEVDRRRALMPACAALVLAAIMVVLPWMARNAVETGQLGVSGRDGENLAIRAEYGRMDWSEVRGAFAYWLPVHHRIPYHDRVLGSVRRWIEPENGYANFDRSRDSYYGRAKRMTGAVAARADRIDPEWRTSQVKCDAVLLEASIELMREHWLKHVVLAPAFGVRSTGVMGAGVLGLLVVPALGAMLLRAWGRRDMALALVALPAAYVFAIYAVATHFIPRYAEPAVPVLFVACALVTEKLATKLAAR